MSQPETAGAHEYILPYGALTVTWTLRWRYLFYFFLFFLLYGVVWNTCINPDPPVEVSIFCSFFLLFAVWSSCSDLDAPVEVPFLFLFFILFLFFAERSCSDLHAPVEVPIIIILCQHFSDCKHKNDAHLPSILFTTRRRPGGICRGADCTWFFFLVLCNLPREGDQVEFAGVPSARCIVAVPRACLHVHEALNFFNFFNFFYFFALVTSL